MDIKTIKDNIKAVEKTFTQTKNIDANSIMLLSIAQMLVLLLEKDGNNDESELLKK